MKATTLVKFLIVSVLVVCMGVVVLIYQSNQSNDPFSSASAYESLTYQGRKLSYNTHQFSLLLMGIDTKSRDVVGQADSMQLYIFNEDKKSIQVLPINRDTMTPILIRDAFGNDIGWHTQHLALSNAYGQSAREGASLTRRAVSRYLMGIPIRYTVSVNLDKLATLSKLMGDVRLTLPNDSLADKNPAWKTGADFVVSPDTIEFYLRRRDINESYSNVERMARQQVFISAMTNQLASLSKKEALKKARALLSVLTTNIGLRDLIDLFGRLDEEGYLNRLAYLSQPGQNRQGTYHDEFIVSKSETKKFVANTFYIVK